MPCNECIKGSIHAGKPIGSIEKVHGLDTYVVGNRTNPRAVVVVYSDIFGLPLPNNKLLADAYARSGEYLVYLPDFFKGDPVPLKAADTLIPVDAAKQSTLSKYTGILAMAPSFVMWMTRHKEGPTSKTCTDFLGSLRRETFAKGLKVGMVGFCWGGRFAIRAAQENHSIDIDGKKTPLVDAVVAMHPSNLVFPTDMDKPVVPISIGWGQDDVGVNIEQKGKMEDVHAKTKAAGHKVPETEHVVYKPGRHGFAVRGNPEDPQERKILEDTEKQAIAWLNKWL